MGVGGFGFGLFADRRPFGDDILLHPLVVFFILVRLALLILRVVLARPVPELIPDRALMLGCVLGLAAFLTGNFAAAHIAIGLNSTVPSMTIDRIFIAYMTVCGLSSRRSHLHSARRAFRRTAVLLGADPDGDFRSGFIRAEQRRARLGHLAVGAADRLCIAIALILAMPYLAGQPAIQLD